jgi:glycosyltransferase involved in cell wall biosynthesis
MIKEKYKIGIWGQFGSGGKIADGQAVRTTIITEEVIDRYGKNNVKVLNTNNWKRNPILFFLRSILLVAESKKVVIFPANNGFKVFVPILSAINLFFNRDLYYVVIGGFLPKLLEEDKKFIKILNKYKGLFVQTINLKKDLENLGIRNIQILSNLKKLEQLDEVDIKVINGRKVSVCTLSRVTYEKGIEDAIKGVNLANQKLGENLITLDIFGMIEKNFENDFQKLLIEYSDFITYKGVIDYDKTVNVLKNYFLLLFPTFYPGEGFPGNIIDSFHSGIPVITTDWLYNSEIIKDKENGLLVPIKNPHAIAEALLLMYQKRELAYEVSLNNLRESKKYDPKYVLKDFFEKLD